LAEGGFLCAKNDKIAFKAINARLETVDTAPSYREAFRRRRCLIPADGFYEWKKVPGGKIPYAIGMKDDSWPYRDRARRPRRRRRLILLPQPESAPNLSGFVIDSG
jgi:SOS response associated peptidase (SRAP)